jgi:hypothetical protein
MLLYRYETKRLNSITAGIVYDWDIRHHSELRYW